MLAIIPGLFAFIHNILPPQYGQIFDTWVKSLVDYFSPYAFLNVPEFYGAGGNVVYDYVQEYLSSSTALSAHHVSLCRPKNATQNTFSLAHNESIMKQFHGRQRLVDSQRPTTTRQQLQLARRCTPRRQTQLHAQDPKEPEEPRAGTLCGARYRHCQESPGTNTRPPPLHQRQEHRVLPEHWSQPLCLTLSFLLFALTKD